MGKYGLGTGKWIQREFRGAGEGFNNSLEIQRVCGYFRLVPDVSIFMGSNKASSIFLHIAQNSVNNSLQFRY